MLLSKDKIENRFRRRDFLRWSARAAGSLFLAPILKACQRLGLIEPTKSPTNLPAPATIQSNTATPVVTVSPQVSPTVTADVARVAFVRTRDRVHGIQQALSLLGQNPVAGKRVLLKPNFNSDDPAPASTHPDTLQVLIQSLQQMGAIRITVADRSGMGNTKKVMKNLGVFDMADRLGFDTLIFDELVNAEDWQLLTLEGDHWENGFPVPNQLLEVDAIVQTCCLKPHRFGGHFTLSLKNSVGMVGKYKGNSGHNYMTELHNSPYQRLMIAESNAIYDPALIVLDGVEAFIDNGPDTGTKVWGDVILAGTDRVAIDAVGLAILRYLGYSGVAADGPIFAQEQISRAVKLGLGIDSAEKIEFVTDDNDSAVYADQINQLMLASG
jgi:uncharacterized protein (DUF362 family)